MTGVRKGYWLPLAATLLAATAGTIFSQNATDKVIKVVVQGNQRLSENAVLAEVQTRVGETYDEATLQADQKRLLESGRFETVTATRTNTPEGIIVTFIVTERPVVESVEFRGNKAFPNKTLNALLPVHAGEGLNTHAVESGRQAILNKYLSSGYADAKVTIDEEALKERRVVYQITEGPRVRVSGVSFEGNHFFHGFKLRQSIGTSARFWPFVAGNLDREQVDRDVHTLRNLYVAEGFLDAKVDRVLKFAPNGKTVKVIFVVEEGTRYRVSEVRFEGNDVFQSQELARRLKLQPGSFITSEALRGDVKKVTDSYGELGYIDAQVTAEKLYKEAPGLVDVAFRIREDGKYNVGKVEIVGNNITQSRVIRRNLGFYPQQPVNTVAISESERRLQELGLFKDVKIRPVGEQEGVRDIMVQVTETQTAQFMVGASVSTNNGVLGNISLTQRNFDFMRWPKGMSDPGAWKGAGQTLTIAAEPGTELMRFHIDWTEPAVFDLPYRLSNRVFFFTRGRETYDETRYGDVASIGHWFKNRWYGEMAARVEGVDINDLDDDAPPEVIEDEGTHGLVGLKGTLVRDRTDSRWNPSRGDRLELSYEQVVGSYNFGRIGGEYSIYKTLYTDVFDRKHVLSGRAAIGNIVGGEAPVFEKFYGGGHGSIRGFEYRGVSPRSRGTDEPIGGDFMLLAGTEYTFPLIGKNLRGAVFLDTGTVEEDAKITTYRAAAGMGLRWIIPMFGQVPMNLDFAFPLAKDKQDDTEIFSFSLGVMF